MANFVEQATLLLNDKATNDIKRVNAALKQLFATSQRMKNMRINLGITPTAITRARQLAAALTKLKIATTGLRGLRITPTISTSAINKLRQLNTAMKQLAAHAKANPAGFQLHMPTVNMTNLANIRQATAALMRYAAALRLARASGGGGLPRVPPPGGGGRNNNFMGGRGSAGDARVWGITAGNVFARIIHRAITGIGQQIATGIQAQDVAETRLNLLPLTAVERTEVNKQIDSLVSSQGKQAGGASLNRQQIEQIMAEVIPGLVGTGGAVSADNAKFMVEQAISLIELQVASGIKSSDAIARAQDFIKAGISSNRIFDPETSLFSKDLATGFFNLMRKLAPIIGEEFTGPFARTMLQNAPRLKGTMSDEALAKFLMIAEEGRTRTFTGVETLANSLFDIVRPAKGHIGQNLVAAGFRTVDDKATTGIDEQRARFMENPFSIMDELVAYMKSKNLDINKSADVAAAAATLAPTARAGGALIDIVRQFQELENQFSFMDRLTGSVEETQGRIKGSFEVAQMNLANSFQGLSGQVFRALEPTLTPEVTRLTKTFTEAAEAAGKPGADMQAITGTLTKGLGELLIGPAGLALGGVGIAEGMGAFLSGVDPLTRAAGLLEAGAGTLLIAANALLDPKPPAGASMGFDVPFLGGVGLKKDGFMDRLVRGDFSAIGSGFTLPALLKAILPGAAHAVPGPGTGQSQTTVLQNALNQANLDLAAARETAVQVAKEHPEGGADNVFFQGAMQELIRAKAAVDNFTMALENVTVAAEKSGVLDVLSGAGRTGTKRTSVPGIIPEDTRLSANRTLRNMQSKANKDEVLAFQKRMGLKEDGIAGKQTRAAMKEATDKFIKAGISIDQIKKIQTDAGIKVDGIVGPQTEQAVALQGWDKALHEILKEGGGVNVINWPGAMANALAPSGSFKPDAGKRPDQLVGATTETPAGGDGTFLGGAISMFEMAFGSGATQIADAGTQAASSIESGLSSGGEGAGASIAGQMIGAAGQVGTIIAAAVRSAASGLSISVNNGGGGGGAGLDTGRTNTVKAGPV